MLANLERHGFAGDIHLINPKRDVIAGRPCLKSIGELPDGIDAAVLAIPSPALLDAVRGLAAKGVGAAVILAAVLPKEARRDWPRRPRSRGSPPSTAWSSMGRIA